MKIKSNSILFSSMHQQFTPQHQQQLESPARCVVSATAASAAALPSAAASAASKVSSALRAEANLTVGVTQGHALASASLPVTSPTSAQIRAGTGQYWSALVRPFVCCCEYDGQYGKDDALPVTSQSEKPVQYQQPR